jgi:hypothetical protein
MVSTVGGSNLALRAISYATDDRPDMAEKAVATLGAAAGELDDGAPRRIAAQFTEWLDEAKGHWAEIA